MKISTDSDSNLLSITTPKTEDSTNFFSPESSSSENSSSLIRKDLPLFLSQNSFPEYSFRDFYETDDEDITDIKELLDIINEAIQITISDNIIANSESSEIIEIMTRKTISTKNVRRIPGYFPLSHQPRKVSLVGRVIFNNTPKEDLLQSVNK